ncbi:MAG: ferritin family protein [Candidatus Zixiibacteriota bacterium]
MDLSNFKEVITFAIRKEADAYNLYITYSDLAKNPGTKVMFKELAQEEQKHREILEGVEKKDVSEYKIDKIPDLKISDFVDDQEFSPDMDYAAALRLAIKREEHAFKLYNHIGSGTENPELKKLFSVLAQEESKHKLRLESEYDENVLMWA